MQRRPTRQELTMTDRTEATITAALAPLLDADMIRWFKVESDRSFTLSLAVSYLTQGRPDLGYDDATKAAQAAVDAAAAALGMTLADAGFEDDGSGEWWSFSAPRA
jgi:hypothetical protein